VYIDPVQRRAQWKLIAVGVRRKLNNGWSATKPARRRSTETAKKLKKHINRQKKYSKTPKQKQGWRRWGMRRRDEGIGSRDIK
jgi:hypothetical protein